MAKISGMLIVSSAPWLSKPRKPSSQPHWKIATRTPNAAPIESRFINTAFSGRISERSITIRTRKLSERTKRMIFHIEPPTWLRTSSLRAVSPPTLTSACCARAEAGHDGVAQAADQRHRRVGLARRARRRLDQGGVAGVGGRRHRGDPGGPFHFAGEAGDRRLVDAVAVEAWRRSGPGRCRRRAASEAISLPTRTSLSFGNCADRFGPGLEREQRAGEEEEHRRDADDRRPRVRHHPLGPGAPEAVFLGRGLLGGPAPVEAAPEEVARPGRRRRPAGPGRRASRSAPAAASSR